MFTDKIGNELTNQLLGRINMAGGQEFKELEFRGAMRPLF